MKKIINNIIAVLVGIHLLFVSSSGQNKNLWQLGESDNSPNEFALAPSGYNDFLQNDFGWEDRAFFIGKSHISADCPYILPGPEDKWGGTSGTAGWRSHSLNILFNVKKINDLNNWKLYVDIFDFNTKIPPLLKVTFNGQSWKYQLPNKNGSESFPDSTGQGNEFLIDLPIEGKWISFGSNEINITSLQGSWIKFDQIRLVGPSSSELGVLKFVYLREVKPANYEIVKEGNAFQPLLIDIEQLQDTPEIKVQLDKVVIFSEVIETGRYIFEAPMPSVNQETKSEYEIFIDGKLFERGTIIRSSFDTVQPSAYVNTMLGTAHSRWMIAPGPWMPFSMVKLSPDNQNSSWQAGYDPIFESIGGFSHIHEWTLSGLLTMPVNGPLVIEVGDEKEPRSGYRSMIDKSTEEALLGYYKVHLTSYDIWAELTSTTRCGFQRYTFPKGKNARVLLDLSFPSEYDFLLDEVKINKVSDYRIEGYAKQRTPDTWSGGITQEYIIHFVAEFDQPIISSGIWTDNKIEKNQISLFAKNPSDAGIYVEFNTEKDSIVKLRTGISYVSIENAGLNLKKEISEPFGWDFEKVVVFNKLTWNKILGRINIESTDAREKVRFYTNMYRSFCSRNTYSDVDGKWVDANENVQQFTDPNSVALGCDAFWNTFWNLNQLWNLVTPEWSNRWVNSQLEMYNINGWLAKGPAGMEYIPVMVAEHEIPLIVGAYQMGIRGFNAEKAYEAMKKMQTVPGKAVAGGFAGNRDLKTYLKHGYVPMNEGRFSNSLEYSFDDWTVSQMAKSLGKEKDYKIFSARGQWWRNVMDAETGYARLRYADGSWEENFDPFKSGANHHYVEGNSWQLTFYVPQDIPGLIEVIGKKRFLERLEWGFNESNKLRFNAPNDAYWDYPVIQGNQQSMHFAYLFNWAGKPWLTQKWSRAILDRYYGYGLANAYLGDEDQGQMSAWFIMNAIGLFQTDGGCSTEPIYEIGSPLYQKIEIDLGNRFGRGKKFTIEAKNASRLNKYVHSAKLNGKIINDFKFPASELLKGGKLELEMGLGYN